MVSPILCIGQSDSSAGTGIQADIKTVQAFDGYAATVITAVAVQTTQTVHGMHMIPPILVREQIEHVIEDLNPQVMKTGMLANTDIINLVGDMLDHHDPSYDGIKLVIDPVMTSRSGYGLLDKEARDAFKRRLLIHADVLTPNIKEAYELSGIEVHDIDGMKHAAQTLRTLGAKVVVLKGGSLSTDQIYDIYADENGVEVFTHPKVETTSTHGAGTTLSAGIAAGLANGLDVREAFVQARAFVNKAMEHAEPIGTGYGPLNHKVKL